MGLLYINLFFSISAFALILLLTLRKQNVGNETAIRFEISRVESSVKKEIEQNRREITDASRNAREELSTSLRTSLETFKNEFTQTIRDFSSLQKESYTSLLGKQTEQNADTTQRLERVREIIEVRLRELQNNNEMKLEQMRVTVDEKLQKTLEVRLGESFKLVSTQLDAVHKGLGEMQQLATGVGDLKKVLTNVKTRGILGEYQLENILDQILTPEQFSKNVKTNETSNAFVEFAIKMPGRIKSEKSCWLPIDSKFPKVDFEILVNAYDEGDSNSISVARGNFIKGIKKCAGDISNKYLDPPNTTDFAILFLPFESLYAEVLRTPGLFEDMQRSYRIIVTGPTTLAAILNSLQMGFRTLAIEKHSGEVWSLLSNVKTEFRNYGDLLDKTQKKLQEASNVIEQASVRSRAIEKKLRDVEADPVKGIEPGTAEI